MTRIPLGPGPEFDLIRRFYRPATATDLSGHVLEAVRVGAGDDCAVVRGEGIALSTDLSVEGIHFRRDWLEPEEIGYRAAAVALSDLAGVAASPIGVLASIAMADADAADMAPRVIDGVHAAAAFVSAVLLGGDTARTTGPLVIDIVAVGNVLRPILRSGARPGDSLWVTGELGASGAAVRAWQRGDVPDPAARRAFALPTPRIAEAIWLAERGVMDALIDISDGLASDSGHLAAASGVRVTIDADSVPVHSVTRREARDSEHALQLALTGGEDYELCLAAPPGAVESVVDAFNESFGLSLTCVGSVHEGAGVLLNRGGAAVEMPWSGYDHFR